MGGRGTVLGISMSSHDRAAALIRDGRVVAAVCEERLDRRKKSQGFYANGGGSLVLPPMAAVTDVLRAGGVGLREIELVVCGRSITTCRDALLAYLPVPPDRVMEPPLPGHHLAHAYSAYATSPFDECDVLVIDEQGSWPTDGTFEQASWFSGADGPLRVGPRSMGTPTRLSLGMFFDVFATITGLAEAGLPAGGKLMALAAHGTPRTDWPRLVLLADSGEVTIDLDRIDSFLEGDAKVRTADGYAGWTPARIEDLRLKYEPTHWNTTLAADLAYKAQSELEAALLHMVAAGHAASGRDHLAYAGGVALNCTANARLLESGYRDVYVHPAATDDGCAIGLAAYGWIEVLGHKRSPVRRFSPYLGRRHDLAEVDAALDEYGLTPHACPVDVDRVADLVAAGRIVCWFAGRSEWGPRALGARSILADPTRPGIHGTLNATVKYREPFRPFGISVAEMDADTALELAGVPAALGPYMLSVAQVRDQRLAACCHRDGTLRYQVVDRSTPEYHALLLAMKERIGIAAVLNTSFNTLGEPLVETPADAVRQFLLCGADALYIEGRLVDLRALPSGVATSAAERAWRVSRLDPLSLALQHEAAGYPQAAAAMVARVPQGRSLGPARLRQRAALLMRLAAAAGRLAEAAGYAEEVLQWSGLPGAAWSAADLLAEAVGEPVPISADAARLVRAMAPQGGALATARTVFGTGPGSAPDPS